MSHQWWGHQVVGANVQGATMLAESFAQYSSMMIMEKTYGTEMIKDLLRYEMDLYLRSRGNESIKEMPLMKVEDQGYIHYRKGSVVMYALRAYIGEEKLNQALSTFARKTAFAEAPYPTTETFLQEVAAVTPDSLTYLIDDLFRKIILYNNKVEDASYTLLDDGTYSVRFNTLTEKYLADENGTETLDVIDDYIDVKIYGDKGKELYSKRTKFQKTENSFSIVVDELPGKVGVDADFLLIDRNTDDNIMKLEQIKK
jgi:aminopeptidase N